MRCFSSSRRKLSSSPSRTRSISCASRSSIDPLSLTGLLTVLTPCSMNSFVPPPRAYSSTSLALLIHFASGGSCHQSPYCRPRPPPPEKPRLHFGGYG